MAVEIKVPPLGESIVEATVGQWLKKPGDAVALGEPVVELETDKVNLEVTAPAAGTLAALQQAEGTTVGVGDTLGTIAEGEGAEPPPAATPSAPPTPAPAEPEPAADPSHRASPDVRQRAEALSVDLSAVSGTGPRGRITRTDVEAFAAKSSPPPTAAETPKEPPVAAPAERRVRLSQRRLTIARRLVDAQHTAAMLTTFNEIDMSAVQEVRRRWRDRFKERYGVSLGLMSFFTKATVGALKAFPEVNAEMAGTELILKSHYDVGIAVATDQGLVVPVVRNADAKSFAEIEIAIRDLAKRARNKELTIEDLTGGTFTITNGGTFGSLLSTPILNMPQVGILGLHAIQDRPVARDGEVVIRPMMYVALTYDHRVIDGSQAVQFLVRVKTLMEDPESLLLEA